MRNVPCEKCNGTGWLTYHLNVDNGKCFQCAGSGSVSVKSRSARKIAEQKLHGSIHMFFDDYTGQPVRVEATEYWQFQAARAAKAFKMYAAYDSAAARKVLRTLHPTAQQLVVAAAK